MSKHSRVAGKDPASAAPRATVPEFDPVQVRARHDGWDAERQVAFIEALAESGCVDHACQYVGMSVASACALRRRSDAQSFRIAWEVALEYAVQRLSDAALSRAIHGVTRPIFFQGEQIGERRYYGNRLAMFILRYRDSPRFGRWLDKMPTERPFDACALRLATELDYVLDDAIAEELGEPALPHTRKPLSSVGRGAEEALERERAEAEAEEARREREWETFLDAEFGEAEIEGDVPSTSSTSKPARAPPGSPPSPTRTAPAPRVAPRSAGPGSAAPGRPP